MVSWIDAFGEGRGQFHAANHLAEPEPSTLDARAQDLPSRTLGIVPKSLAGRSLKLLNNRAGMRLLNWAKHMSGAARPRHTYRQSLVAFSFLLDYVPEWERAYQPGGFLQYQCFIPDAEAKGVFPELTSLQRSERLENFLTVMKRHRRDRFLFSHGVDGYSLAMDFKVDPERRNRLEALCHQMNEIVLNAGGRFYFAKDITLRPADVERYLGKAALRQFRDLKSELDPQNLLTSSLAQRTGLDPG
jgi:decaprenylphospho-beta-D-ribofuranose 2-oxidase